MDRNDFLSLLDGEFQQIRALNIAKGHDYAGDQDALANFKVQGEALGIDPLKVWGIFAGKHWAAVMTYCKEGQVQSEAIEGRVRDLILYGFLLLGLIAEENDVRSDEEIEASRLHREVDPFVVEPTSKSAFSTRPDSA